MNNLKKRLEGKIKHIVVFGDSNLDSGNVYKLTNSQVPGFPFWNQRFCDGPTWVDALAEVTGAKISNNAYGGATINNSLVAGRVKARDGSTIVVPGVFQQICCFISEISSSNEKCHFYDPSSTLYVVKAGSNDLTSLIMPQYYDCYSKITPAGISAELMACIKTLRDGLNAKNFTISNSISSDRTPFIRSWALAQSDRPELLSEIKDRSIQFNKSLWSSIAQFKQENPSIVINQLDVYELVESIYKDPVGFGFDSNDFAVPAFNWESRFSAMDNIDASQLYNLAKKRLWWDDSHISSAVHKLLLEITVGSLSL